MKQEESEFMLPIMLTAATYLVLQCGPVKFAMELDGKGTDFVRDELNMPKITYLGGPMGQWETKLKDGHIYLGDWPCVPTTDCSANPERKC